MISVILKPRYLAGMQRQGDQSIYHEKTPRAIDFKGHHTFAVISPSSAVTDSDVGYKTYETAEDVIADYDVYANNEVICHGGNSYIVRIHNGELRVCQSILKNCACEIINTDKILTLNTKAHSTTGAGIFHYEDKCREIRFAKDEHLAVVLAANSKTYSLGYKTYKSAAELLQDISALSENRLIVDSDGYRYQGITTDGSTDNLTLKKMYPQLLSVLDVKEV